ncbi:MAG: hypothetical protein ABEI06_10085 [Halobacteriaceae archaeon]
MTVALLGIGADSTNATPTPPVYADGSFEYIPIPEAQGPEGTVETRTYGNTRLRHQDAPMAEFLNGIDPHGRGNFTITGQELVEWPLHYDPNFEALTYGETTSRGAYTKILRNLQEGDIVAFYTGLQQENDGYRHRYIIGYFTVDEILDCQNLEWNGQETRFSDLSKSEQEQLMDNYCGNAHAKRFKATGEIADNDGLVIVNGTEPSTLLNTAFRISKQSDNGHYYLTDRLQRRFQPDPSGDPAKNAHLGGVKTGHRLNIDIDEFQALVE